MAKQNVNSGLTGGYEPGKKWVIAYCDYQELNYQFNMRGLIATPDLLQRLSERTEGKTCGMCEVTLRPNGEVELLSYTQEGVDVDPLELADPITTIVESSNSLV